MGFTWFLLPSLQFPPASRVGLCFASTRAARCGRCASLVRVIACRPPVCSCPRPGWCSPRRSRPWRVVSVGVPWSVLARVARSGVPARWRRPALRSPSRFGSPLACRLPRLAPPCAPRGFPVLSGRARLRALWGNRGWGLPTIGFLVAACPQPWRGRLLRVAGWFVIPPRFRRPVASVAGFLFVPFLALLFLWLWSVAAPPVCAALSARACAPVPLLPSEVSPW